MMATSEKSTNCSVRLRQAVVLTTADHSTTCVVCRFTVGSVGLDEHHFLLRMDLISPSAQLLI